MKLIHSFIILSIIYIALCARTCTDEDEAALRKERESLYELQDSIKKMFEVGIPDDQQLKSFEAKAKQKLIDFSEYMRIASDSSMDIKLRKQAGEMAERLFVSGESNIKGWSKAIQDSNLLTLNQLIEVSLSQGLRFWIKPVQINVMNHLSCKDDSIFSGTLSFIQDCVPFPITTDPDRLPYGSIIDIYVIRKPKTFGIEVIRVWEIYLGDIRNQEL